jgi:hypothetical protein
VRESALFVIWGITLKKVITEAISAVILERSEGSRGGKNKGLFHKKCGKVLLFYS